MGSNSSNPGIVQRGQLSSFTPIQPIYAPKSKSGHGRHQILIYDSRSYPGRRREFSYKTSFTNQSGLTTVYYRCMACRAIRQQVSSNNFIVYGLSINLGWLNFIIGWLKVDYKSMFSFFPDFL